MYYVAFNLLIPENSTHPSNAHTVLQQLCQMGSMPTRLLDTTLFTFSKDSTQFTQGAFNE